MKTAFTIGVLGAFALLMIACSDATANYAGTNATGAKEVTEETGTELKFSNENSKINFLGEKVTGHHDGGFNKFAGKAVIDGDTLKQVEVTIDMDSIWTDNDEADEPKLTGHLKTADFFDVKNHPESKFISTGIKKGGEGGTHTITGNLTMRGKTKSISFPADITLKDGTLTAKAKFKIDRQQWGVHFKGMEDNLIKDEVGLALDISAG
ncbi:MAG: YceI family protein [Planctomycetes bacterium]|nr:YceI family protein [Planctomycetota bacterium]